MKSASFAGVLPLAFIIAAAAPAAAQIRADASGNAVSEVFDVSNETKAPLYCQITVTTTATNLANLLSAANCAAVPSWGQYAQFVPESPNLWPVRIRADGTAATATVGMPLPGNAWSQAPLVGGAANMWLISTTGGGVAVDVQIRG